MANDEEGMDFWQAPAGAKEQDKEVSEEIGDDQIGTMKLKVPKPIFNTPTKCKIVEMKFFKVDKVEKNQKNDGEYTPFFATVTFQEIGGKEVEFKENYRGGRMYVNKDDKTGQVRNSTYIGPMSSLGKLKAVCVDNKINVGSTIKEWAENVKGTIATVKAESIMYLGKKYDKNTVLAVQKA